MVKPGWVEPKSPAVQSHTCRSTSEATTPDESVGTDDWRRLSAASDLQRVARRGRGWAPKRPVRLTRVNAGSPTSCEAHGDGVPIVLNCGGVMPETWGRGTESIVRT